MTPSQQIAIGIGCSSRASSDDILELIQSCASELPAASILATLDRRAAMGTRVAKSLGLRLILFPASELATVEGISTHSAVALKRTETANVAEASALASLGPEARLIVRRQTGRFCTCAVATLTVEGNE
jgi:cobalt-precorrin 5A hydrolase